MIQNFKHYWLIQILKIHNYFFGAQTLRTETSEKLIFHEEWKNNDFTKWMHETQFDDHAGFAYYRNNRSNTYTENNELVITPTVTSDEFGENFLFNGRLDLGQECTGKRDYLEYIVVFDFILAFFQIVIFEILFFLFGVYTQKISYF